MVIFPLAPGQIIAQMWSNGARGGGWLTNHRLTSCRVAPTYCTLKIAWPALGL